MKLNILNYKHVLAIAFMGLAVCISSCKDDEEGITGFRLDKESIELPDNGGEGHFRFQPTNDGLLLLMPIGI